MKRFIIRLVISLLALPLIGICLVIYAFYIEPNQLIKKEYDIELKKNLREI